MKKTLTTLCLLVLSQTVHAVPEAQILQTLDQTVIPYFQSAYKTQEFRGVNQVPIKYYQRKVSNPNGVVIFSPGQSEASLKYAEFLYDIQDLNYDIYIIDHRSQGYSGRLISDPGKTHVEHFQDYVDDLTYLINEIVHPEKYKNSVLIGHSMGGAISTGYLLQNPKKLKAALLSAPMLQINTGYFNNLSADVIATSVDILGLGNIYAPTQKPYNPNSRFEDNKETSSFNRFIMKKMIYNPRPEIQVGGTTFRWLKESLQFTVQIRTNTDVKLQTPTVVFQAGHDQYVLPYGQNRFCEELNPQMCKLVRTGFETSQHEILMETDSIRSYAIKFIKNYIQYFEEHTAK